MIFQRNGMCGTMENKYSDDFKFYFHLDILKLDRQNLKKNKK